MEKIYTNKLKKIVIIGGSASGFSSACNLLNGPGLYENNASLNKFPNARIKQLLNCSECCIC